MSSSRSGSSRAAAGGRRGAAGAAPATPAAPAPVPEPGAAGYLVLPGPDDPLWASVPLGLRQNLAMPAYQLVNPARGHLTTPAGRKLKSALGAAARGKLTGTHWLALLTAPRAAFGGPTSQRAGQVYKALEQLVADHLRPALGTVASAEFTAGVELAQAAPAGPPSAAVVPAAAETGTAAAPVPDTPSATAGTTTAVPEPDADVLPATLRPAPAPSGDVPHPATPAAVTPLLPNAVNASPATLAAPTATDPAAAVHGPAPAAVTLPTPAVPDPDSAAPARPGPAAETPVPTPASASVGDLAELLHVTAEDPREILAVTSARTTTAQTALAQAQDLAPVDLPIVQVSGHDRSSLARALYTRLGLGRHRPLPGLDEAEDLITAELRRASRLVIATTTLGLRPSALQLLHRLWEPKPFPLVLVGDTTLDGLLKRHDLAELHPHVTLHRVQEPTPAPAPAPASAADPAREQAATPGPAAAPEAAGPAAPAPPPGTAAPDGDLAADLREATEHRSVLVVTTPAAATASAALTHALDTGALRPLYVHGTALDQVVPALFKGLGLGHRRPRTLDTAVVKVTAELRRSPRLVVVPAAHELPEDALRWLGLLWTNSAFPLVLGGDLRLDDVLARPELTGLYTSATRRHLTAPTTAPEAADVPAPASAARPHPMAAAAPDPGPATDTTPGATPPAAPAPAPAVAPSTAAADTTGRPGPATPAEPPVTPAAAPEATTATDSLLQDLLTTVEHRAILCVTAPEATTATAATATAAQQQPLPTVWVRPHPGTDEAALVHTLYTELGLDHRHPQPRARNTALELIAAELDRATRLLVVPDAHRLSTAALELLYGLWAPGGPERFPLVLAGEPGLDAVLGRPKLASLKSCVFIRHRLDPAGPAADPAPEARDSTPATPADVRTPGEDLAAPRPAPATPVQAADPAEPAPTASPTGESAAGPAPAAGPAAPAGDAVPATLQPATSPADETPTAPQTPAPGPASGPLPPTPALVLAPSPTTLHQARSTLPQMISAAGQGTSTPLTRGTHHALLTAPATATALGWDLTTATAHGTADARKKLGDLIQHAATGQPQVLRRHVTPLAVLLPAAPDGTPIPPAGTPDAAATNPPSTGVVTPHPAATPAATPSTAAAVPPPAPAPETRPAPDRTTPTASTTHPSTGVEPDDTLFPTLTAPSGQPAPAPVEPNPAAETNPATSSSPAPAPAAAASEPALQDPAATTPPADQPATAAPAAPRAPRRLAPLADALTTVLTPAAPDTDLTPTGPRALSTGIPGLDDALGGLQPGRFYLAAAAPGAGGSLLATTTARTTALDHHLPVLYAASGLTRADVAARIVAAHLPVDYRRLRTGRLTPAEQADAATLHTELAAAHLYIDDGTDLTPDAIAETAADLAHTTTDQPDQPGLALVVVDRLQAADDPRLPLSGPRLTDAAQALAHLARTHHVPVLAILDTDQPDLITTLGLDTTLTLHPHPDAPTTQLLVTIAERDLGTQATLTLTADRTHARLTDPTPFNPYAHRPAPEAPHTTPVPEAPTPAPTAPAPEAPTNPPTTAPEAPTQASDWPTTAVPGHPAQDTAAAPDSEVTPATAAALDALANLTPDQPPAHPLRPTQERAARTTASKPARTGGGDYAGRDYGHFLDMISSVVDQTLQEHGGDTEAAITALELKAIPNGMALFEATRVGGNYEHTVYPERLEFLSKKSRDGADDIWEGRHKWENGPLMEQLKAGTHPDIDVDVLDTNAAFCSALKTWLPIGALQHDPDGGFHPKRSGIYLLPQRPTWEHPHLPDPIGNRREPGPVLLDDATIRLLIRCHKLGLAEAPHITQAWTSGASENIAEKFRRVLTIAREKAILDGDDVTEKYVKAIYSKFVSTIGESSFNRDLRRPDWMHIIRSQAFANLWYKAHRAHEHGLTIVRLRGTDELHITGDTAWRTVFTEGRLTTQLKLKTQYTLYAKAA